MAQYLIVHEYDDGTFVRNVEAKNMKEAARSLVDVSSSGDGFTATIWRVAGPPKTITLTVETAISVDVT